MATERMDQIVALVGSRRYCFVIMPYKSLGLLYEHIRGVIESATGLAATRPQFIKDIRNGLRDVDLRDKTRTIWALVHGRPDPQDEHVSPEYVHIEDVGVVP